MQVRWSPEAADSFEDLCAFVRNDNPEAAHRIANTIYSAASSLVEMPMRGRVGRLPGTRELVLAPLPYLIIYRVKDTAVEIIRIVQGAQQWPQAR